MGFGSMSLLGMMRPQPVLVVGWPSSAPLNSLARRPRRLGTVASLPVYTSGVSSEPLRALLDRHLRDWRITETADRMEVTGWLKAGSVEVTLRGLRGDVVEALQALIA